MVLSKKYLADYYSREIVEQREFLNSLMKPTKAKYLKYPKESRFSKINYPVSLVGPQDIWSQIPLYGTTFVQIPPWSQDQLIEYTRWGTSSDLEKLISLAKETGKVQFLLTAHPLDYEKLEYLHPLLEELEPPNIIGNLAVDISTPVDKMYYDEFMNEAKKFFVSEMERLYSHVSDRYVQKRIYDYASDYVILKKIGYHEISDLILANLNTEPDLVSSYFNVFGNFVAVPASNPLLSSYKAISTKIFSEYEKDFEVIKQNHKSSIKEDVKKSVLPGEIGHFLMEKLVPLTSSYESAIALMTRFEDRELHGLLNAINEGFQKNDMDVVNSTRKDLSEEFDNVWKEADKINKIDNAINAAFTLSLIAIGTVLTLPVGGIGALAGLGFNVADRYLPSSSTKIANFFSPNHLVAINNFKKINLIKN